MHLNFPELNLPYKSPSQRIRVLSETWLKNEMYCPACGYDYLIKNPNNSRMADFHCGTCGEIYELKSMGHNIGKTILDGAYSAALERITSNTNPNLFVLHYQENIVKDLIFVPKYFFTPDILKKRNPLSSNARRAGYVGCIFLFENISERGKIAVIKSQVEQPKKIVLENYSHSLKFKTKNINSRGWLMDIIKCVDKITHDIFTLKEMYAFIPELANLHPDNHRVDEKIRQTLQILRNKGIIKFLNNRGLYQKISKE